MSQPQNIKALDHFFDQSDHLRWERLPPEGLYTDTMARAAVGAVLSSAYNFTPQQPGGSLTAATPATITLKPVPLGVNHDDTQHWLYISGGTGTAEAVLITGGSGHAGDLEGTITFTPVNNHSGAWTISSASAGIKEAANDLSGTGLVQIPKGTHQIYETLVLPTTISLVGQGTNSTILNCASAADPGLAIADSAGTSSQGLGVHSSYKLYGPGSGVGLWIGGDPSAVFAPSAWLGSYVRFYDIHVANFSTALHHRKGNFVVYINCAFHGLTRALIIPDDTGGETQPLDFYGTVLSVPSGSAVQMDAEEGYSATPLQFFGGQVSGAIVGTAVDWESFGTHYEPSTSNEGIVNITAAGTHKVSIHGGILSVHGTSLAAMIKMEHANILGYLSIKDAWVQAASGMTVTDFVKYGNSTGGLLTIENNKFAPAGTFTNLYTTSGTVKVSPSPFTHRGDPAAEDYETTDFTKDAAWHDLDLSSLVPSGVTAVVLTVYAQATVAGAELRLQKNGNANGWAVAGLVTQVADLGQFGNLIVAVDSSRVIEYKLSNHTWTYLYVTVAGWWK